MRIYVESNFVLELALLQEQHEACSRLIEHARESRIAIALPAFSLAEPHHTLGRRARNRRNLSDELGSELAQLSRSDSYSEEVDALRGVTGLLVRSGDDESARLRETLQWLVRVAELLPLDRGSMERAWKAEYEHSLFPPDAIVLGSVLNHLEAFPPDDAVFLNRNVKDFDDPDIVRMLDERRCRLIPSFNNGLRLVEQKLSL